VHCRKCWQLTLQMTRRCAFCGDTDIVRRAKGLGELLNLHCGRHIAHRVDGLDRCYARLSSSPRRHGGNGMKMFNWLEGRLSHADRLV
jgi:RNA polymerase subunit RPABC4/transcription elongation factor Spt4